MDWMDSKQKENKINSFPLPAYENYHFFKKKNAYTESSKKHDFYKLTIIVWT